MSYFVGTDVGGTFTDLWVVAADGAPRVFKSPTTADVMTGVLDATRLAASDYGVSFDAFCANIKRFGHGTTVGLNALLTGRAAKTAILTTRGFGDTLEIGRMKRQTAGLAEHELGDWRARNRHPPLVPRALVVEVIERVDVNGRIVVALDEAHARAAIASLAGLKVDAVAVCTLWATRNPLHELRLGELVKQALPNAFVTLSHQIAPVVGEYGRMCTAAANAALGPLAGRYLARLEAALQAAGMRCPILMMTSSGGVLPTAAIADRPASAVFSGPSACVMGAVSVAAQLGTTNLLTIDIGGTSFDVGVIVEGKPLMRAGVSLAGADLNVPSIDVASIGAGGGSIARVRFGDLSVGPQSAGANPGPACYARGGTDATATDADLVLGVLNPDYFIGGRMRLDMVRARAAINASVAQPLGLDTLAAAWGMREVLDNKMADLLRRVTVERGHDPRDFLLLAAGGAGPSHAWSLARELGLSGFVVPPAATAQSAFGTANTDLGLAIDRPVYLRVNSGVEPSPDECARIAAAAAEASSAARAGLADAGSTDVHLHRTLAIRYRGQANALDVSVDNDLAVGGSAVDQANLNATELNATILRFERDYERLFGRGAGYRRAGFEVIGLRVIARGSVSPPQIQSGRDSFTSHGSRAVVFDDPKAPTMTHIYRAAFPAPDQFLDGPCIVEYPGQSAVVPPGARASTDRLGNLHVRFASAA